MVSLVHLPPETLIQIFLQLPVDDCLNFAKTCKVINKASDIDLLWAKKIRQDFKISANIYSGKYPSHSARNFYRHILYKYGKLLGLWQVTTFGPSGGLLQVSIGYYVPISQHLCCQKKARKIIDIFDTPF
jgi:hypothetical protein